jgi:hypothetical protein
MTRSIESTEPTLRISLELLQELLETDPTEERNIEAHVARGSSVDLAPVPTPTTALKVKI